MNDVTVVKVESLPEEDLQLAGKWGFEGRKIVLPCASIDKSAVTGETRDKS